MQLPLPKGFGSASGVIQALKDLGGRPFIVGGLPRDALLALENGRDLGEAQDIDIEVYGLSLDAVRRALAPLGSVDDAGSRFGVLRLLRNGLPPVDVALPRQDRKVGAGHRGFVMTCNPDLTFGNAAARRDFTINALLWDPTDGSLHDPFGGIEDLRARRLRAVSEETFAEDPLRVLRALHFAARFELSVEPKTKVLCAGVSLKDLSRERVGQEFEKLLMRARRPSIGLELAREFKVLDQRLPELAGLVGCPQDERWHPEGDVWIHTLQVIDEAALIRDTLDAVGGWILMLSALCHDLGKPATTTVEAGRIRALGHDRAGLPYTRRVLDEFAVFSRQGVPVREKVLELVAEHLAPASFHRDNAGKAAIRRLASRCDMRLLLHLAHADLMGRRCPGRMTPEDEATPWLAKKLEELGPVNAPLLTGQDLVALGFPEGRELGEALKSLADAQSEGVIVTREDAYRYVERLRPPR